MQINGNNPLIYIKRKIKHNILIIKNNFKDVSRFDSAREINVFKNFLRLLFDIIIFEDTWGHKFLAFITQDKQSFQ